MGASRLLTLRLITAIRSSRRPEALHCSSALRVAGSQLQRVGATHCIIFLDVEEYSYLNLDLKNNPISTKLLFLQPLLALHFR